MSEQGTVDTRATLGLREAALKAWEHHRAEREVREAEQIARRRQTESQALFAAVQERLGYRPDVMWDNDQGAVAKIDGLLLVLNRWGRLSLVNACDQCGDLLRCGDFADLVGLGAALAGARDWPYHRCRAATQPEQSAAPPPTPAEVLLRALDAYVAARLDELGVRTEG